MLFGNLVLCGEPPGPAERLQRVVDLIDGFETPYGMELLSSVHWVALHEPSLPQTADEAVEAVHRWNDRKRAMFVREHIRIAWSRLQEQGWLPAGGQGQRTLSSFSGKDLHQEVNTPAGHATLHDVAFLAWMVLDQAQGEAA